MRSIVRLWTSDSPALVMVGRLAVSFLGVLSALVIARAVGPAGRGETAAVIAAFYLVPIFIALGVPLEVRRAAATGGIRLQRAIRRYSLLSLLPAGLVAWSLHLTLFDGLGSVTSQWMATIGILCAPLTVSWMCDASIVFARRQFRSFVAVQLAQPGLFLGLLLIIWATDSANVAGVLAANIAGTSLTAVVAGLLARGADGDQVATLRGLIAGGLRFAGSAIAEAASNRLDQVLVLPLVGAYQAGLYSVAVTISSVPIALGHALGGAYFTPVARASDPRDRQRLKSEALRTSVVLGLGCCTLVAITAPLVVSVVFGSSFSAATSVAWVSIAGAVPMITAYVVAQTLAAEGKGLRMTLAQVLALCMAVGLLIFLGPRYGALGAAAASSISYVLLLGMLVLMSSLPARTLIPRPRDLRVGLKSLMSGAK